jgi:hypothetical protein
MMPQKKRKAARLVATDDPCENFALLDVGFGPDKNHITNICDLGPGFTQPCCMYLSCAQALVGHDITVAADWRTADNQTVLQSYRDSLVINNTNQFSNLGIAPTDVGTYSLFVAIMTDDGACYDEKTERIQVIRTPRSLYIASVTLATSNDLPKWGLDAFAGQKLTIYLNTIVDSKYLNVPMHLRFEIHSKASGALEYVDDWQASLSSVPQTIVRAYDTMPAVLPSLCQGDHVALISIETLDHTQQYTYQNPGDLFVYTSTFGHPGTPCPGQIAVTRIKPTHLDAQLLGLPMPRMPLTPPHDPPQVYPFGCVAIDATNDGGAMNDFRQLYPLGSNHESTQECVQHLSQCAGISRPSAAIVGHGNIGFICIGGGNSGDHTPDQIIGYWNRPDWLIYIRLLRNVLGSLYLLGCETGACNEGATLLSYISTIVNCPVTSTTALLWVGSDGYYVDDGGGWITATPNSTPAPQHGPAVVCPSGGVRMNSRSIPPAELAVFKTEDGYVYVSSKAILEARWSSKPGQPATALSGAELAMGLYSKIDLATPFERDAVPLGIITSELSITFRHPDGALEVRRLLIIADRLAQDQRFRNVYYRLIGP